MFYCRNFLTEQRLWLETEKPFVIGCARMPLCLQDDCVGRVWNESRLQLLAAFTAIWLVSH